MELRQSVSATLVQIVAGVKDAQDQAAEFGAAIVPAGQGFDDLKVKNRIVEFDVGVTTSEATQTKGGIGIFVGAIGVGSQGQSANNSEAQNRVRFSVPVYLPGQRV